MGPQRPLPLVLDAGALIAFERGARAVVLLLERATRDGAELHITAGVVAQVWRGARQARIASLLRRAHVHAFDETDARAAGVLCAMAQTTDVIDASVALLARRRNAVVVTSDPEDLRRLDPTIRLAVC